MKLTKVLTAVFFTVTASMSIQAAELIKVEPLNKLEFSNLLQLDLAQSIKSMQVKAINVEASAETLLIAQNAKITNDKEITISKLSLVTE
jgi:hypothetical protein